MKELTEYTPEYLRVALGYNKIIGEFTFTNTNKRTDAYLRTNVFGQYILTHRLVWYIETGRIPYMLDHINGVGEDNRIENLRECTRQENNRNRIVNKTNVLGIKNISERLIQGKYRQFLCRIRDSSSNRISKTFSFNETNRELKLEQAIEWVNVTRRLLHKEFACGGRLLTECGVGY